MSLTNTQSGGQPSNLYGQASSTPSLLWSFDGTTKDLIQGVNPSYIPSSAPGYSQLKGSAAYTTAPAGSNVSLSLNGTTGTYMGSLTTLSGGANWINSNLFVEAWVYVNSFGTSSNLINHGTNWSCGFTPSGNFQMNINNQGLTSAATVPLTTWTHVAFSFSHQTATSNLMYVFVNGTLSGGPTSFTGVPTTTSQYAYIGWDGSTTKYSNFYVQDLRVAGSGSGGNNNNNNGCYLVCPTSSFTPIVGPFPLDNSPPTYESDTTLYSGATVWTLQTMFKNISYTTGKFGQGIYLVSNSQNTSMARVSLPVNLTTTSPFSISVWIKVSDPYSSTYRDFVAISGTNNYIAISAPGWKGVTNFEIYQSRGTYNGYRYMQYIALDTNWFHVVLTNDGTLNNFIAYFNGGNKSKNASTTAIQSDTINTIFLATNGTCTISDLRVYNTALTDAQVLEVYNQGGMPVTGFFKLTGTPLFSQISPAAQSSAVGAFSLRAVNRLSPSGTAKAVNVRPVSLLPPSPMTSAATQSGNQFTQTLTGYPFGGAGTYTANCSSFYAGGYPYFNAPYKVFDTDTTTFWENAFTPAPANNQYNGINSLYQYSNTYNTTTNGTAVYSTPIGSSTYYGEWLQIQLPTAIVLTSYSMYGRVGYAGTNSRMPYTWLIAGSNDSGATWTLVDTQTAKSSSTWISSQITVTFTPSTTTAYSWFRMVITELNTGGNTGQPSIGQWNLYGSPVSAWNADFYADRLGNLLTAPVTGQTLSSWLGGATGYVATWYDQSGKGNDATQTTLASQPKIQKGTKGSGYMVLFEGAQRLSSSTLDLRNTPYTLSVCERTTGLGSYFYANRNPVVSYSAPTSFATDCAMHLGHTNTNIYVMDQTNNGQSATVTAFTSSTTEPLRYVYASQSTTSNKRIYVYNDPLGNPINPGVYTNGINIQNNANTANNKFFIGYHNYGPGAGAGYELYYYGEAYEILVFNKSLYDLDGTTDTNVPTTVQTIYNNQLSYTGT